MLYFPPLCVKDRGGRSEFTWHLKLTLSLVRFGTQGNAVERFSLSHLWLGTQGNVAFFVTPFVSKTEASEASQLGISTKP